VRSTIISLAFLLARGKERTRERERERERGIDFVCGWVGVCART